MKQTEIGLIPDDWEVKSLGDLAFVTKLAGFEFTAHVKYSDLGKIIALRGLNVRKGFLILDDVKYIDDSNFSKLGRSRLFIDDLLFTYVGTVGNAALVEKNNIYYLAPNVALIRCNKHIHPKFLMYLILSKSFFDKQISTLMSTTSQAALSMTNIRLFEIPLPPFAEQQRIAKALSDVDTLISTTEKLIQKKKNIKQGTMQELLTGKKRLPGFGPQIKSSAYKQTELGPIPEDWEVKSLGDIFSIKHGYGFEGQFFSSENNQHIVVTPGNFKLEGGFQKQKQPIYYTGTYPDEFKLKPNNLIIMMTDLSKNSDTLGNPAIVPDDGNYYLHNQRIGLIQIHNDSFVKDYIYLLLCTKEYHESVVATAAGSTVKHTSPNRIYSINFVVSTSKEEQTAIANVLSSMDKEIETLNTKLEKYRNLKTAMMQQLLTGKIRL